MVTGREDTTMRTRTDVDEHVPAQDQESYEFSCPTCGRIYNTCQAEWCDCITDNPTFVCPHCKSCFCGSSVQERKDFWEGAPPTMWRRRLKKGFRTSQCPPSELGNPIRRPLVLVVDDEYDTRIVAFRVLEALGYGVLLAQDGAEAFELAKHYQPDLILTDQMMPKLDGKHLCRLIKETPETSHIRVILMTGLYKKESQRIEILKDFRADDFLTKPIAFHRLGEVLEGWLASALVV